ncbi:low-density lipoprotein receptor-related protein 5-like protein [Styela clava]|uniref:low-density lipoprotein receptor-related protein 5-like n=1 Tax=Styela clava TaxID=7725 RepID=UPI00193A4CDF|nr:low-density lipoprotein receptor-related protein 5-like [Styela clava]
MHGRSSVPVLFVLLLGVSSLAYADWCEEKFADVPKESPVIQMLITVCRIVDIIKNSQSNKTESDERLYLAVLLRTDNLVFTEEVTGQGDFNSTELTSLPGGIAVDFDPVEGFMYCTEKGIYKTRLDGSDYSIVFNSTVTGEGLAIDWVARNIYWTEKDAIKVSRMDGSRQKKLLINDTLDGVRPIAVDPSRGKIYWTEWGDNPRIASAWMDGSNVKTLVSDDIQWPNGMAIDIKRNKIYWGDAYTDKIYSINTDGTERKTLSTGDNPHIFGMSYLDDYIYWTDWKTNQIERFNVAEDSINSYIATMPSDMQPFGIKATKLYPPPGITSPCGQDNGRCAHLCFNTPEGIRCGCEDGWELEQGGSCVKV